MKEQKTKINIELLQNKGKPQGIWYLMQGYQLLYVIAICCLAIAALVRAGSFLLLKLIVDDIFPLPNLMEVIYLYIAGFVGLAGCEALFTFIQRKLTARSAEGTIKRLRNFLFDHIQRLPFIYHDKTDTGDILERVTSDVETLHRFYSEQAIEIGRIVSLFMVSFISLFTIHPFLGAMSIVCFPLILIQAVWFFKRIEKSFSACQEQEAVISTIVQENIAGIRVVQACSGQDMEIEEFNTENREKFKRGKKLVFLNASFWPMSDIICFIQTLFIYVLGGWMVIQGEISIGSFLAVMGLVIWAVWPLRDLGRVIIQSSSAGVSFLRVLHILKEKPEPTNGKIAQPLPVTGNLEFKKVTFSYGQGETILDNISFSCSAGQTIAIVGPTGSGKSTLINLIPRFYSYTKGSIVINGKELSSIPLHELRNTIGIVEQEPFLFSRTIKENIAYGAGENISMKKIEHAAKVAAIHDVIMGFPEQYATLIGEKGSTLSGGQRQRIAIARTILKDPQILILDDATSSVDTGTEAAINKALYEVMKGRTSFIIAHRIETVMRADLIIVLEAGKIVQNGNHDTLIREQGLYKKIFTDQLINVHTQTERRK